MRQPQASRNNALLPKRQSVQMPGPTPGQQTKHMLTLRAVLDPQSNMNRQTLSENFGIQLPLINSKQTSRPAYSKPIIGSTIEPLAVLPKANRVDAQVTPPPSFPHPPYHHHPSKYPKSESEQSYPRQKFLHHFIDFLFQKVTFVLSPDILLI